MNVSVRGHDVQVDDEHKEFWESVAAEQWEPFSFDVLDRFLRPDITFVDIGAWIGPLSLYAAKIGKVIAIEPDPVAIRFLMENLKANQSNAVVINQAIVDYHGTVRMSSEALGNSETRITADLLGQDFLVECDTLTGLCGGHEGDLFLKLDVEGAEEQILRQAEFFALRKPTVYLSLHPVLWRSQWGALESLCKVARFYRYTLNAETMLPIDMESGICSHMLFTDEL